MIVLDIETSGGDFRTCGIWQIGALDLDNPSNVFLQESRIDEEDLVEEGALRVIGKTELELRDFSKQSQEQLLENFFKWCEGVEIKNCICHNPQFDLGFIWTKISKYGIKKGFDFPLPHRALDVHSIATLKFFQLKKRFLIRENQSDMGLSNILSFVGMKDNRGAHNALEDARLTAECFSRMVYGRGLLEEYSKFQMPSYLKGGNLYDNI